MENFDEFLEQNSDNVTQEEIFAEQDKATSAFVTNEVAENTQRMATTDYAPTAEETFESETGINPNESLWDEVVAGATGFGRGASLGIVSQDDNKIAQSAQQISPIVDASADALGSVATTLATAGMTSGYSAPAAISKGLKLNTVISSALSRGLIFGQTGGIRNTVDVAKGKKDVTQALKDTGSGIFGSMFSVLPEAIGGPKLMQLFYQPVGGVVADWGARRLLDEYPNEETKSNEGSIENFIRTYGFNIALDMGFAMLDVHDVSFRSSQKQIRRELAGMAAHPLSLSSYKLIKPKAEGKSALDRVKKQMDVETIAELEEVYIAKAEELGITVEQLKEDVIKNNAAFDNISTTYGKANKVPEAIDRATQMGKESNEAKENIKNEVDAIKIETEREAVEAVDVTIDKDVVTEPKVEADATNSNENIQVDADVKVETEYIPTDKDIAVAEKQYENTSVANLITKLNRVKKPLSPNEKIVLQKVIDIKNNDIDLKRKAIQDKKDLKAAEKEKKIADLAEEKRIAVEEKEVLLSDKKEAAKLEYKEKQEAVIARATTLKQLDNIETRHKTKETASEFADIVAAKRKEIQDKIDNDAQEKIKLAEDKTSSITEKKIAADKLKAEKEAKRVADKKARDSAKESEYIKSQTELIGKRTTLTQLDNMENIYKKKNLSDKFKDQLDAQRKIINDKISEKTNAAKKKAEEKTKADEAKKKEAELKEQAEAEAQAEADAQAEVEVKAEPKTKVKPKKKPVAEAKEVDKELDELLYKLDVAKSKDDAEGIQKAVAELKESGYERVNKEWVKSTSSEAVQKLRKLSPPEFRVKLADLSNNIKTIKPDELEVYKERTIKMLAEGRLLNEKHVLYLTAVMPKESGVNTNVNSNKAWLKEFEKPAVKLLNEFNKLFGTDIKLITIDAAHKAQGMSYDGYGTIALNSRHLKNINDLSAIMAHEFGHTVHKDIILKTGQNDEVYAEYKRQLEKSDTVGEFNDTQSSPLRREIADTYKDVIKDAPTEGQYFSSYSEWVAEQVNLFMHTDKVAKTKVEGVFKRAAAKIKELMKNVLAKYESGADTNPVITKVLNDIIDGKVEFKPNDFITPKELNISDSRSKKKRRREDRLERKAKQKNRRSRRRDRTDEDIDNNAIDDIDAEVRTDEDSFISSDDLREMAAVNSIDDESMKAIIKKALANADNGSITRANNQVLIDNIGVILRHANNGSLNPKMKALKKASAGLTSVFKKDFDGELFKNPEHIRYIKEFNARNPELKSREYDSEKLASAYIGNANDFQYKYPDLFKIVDDAVKLNIGGARDGFVEYGVEKMLNNADEATRTKTMSMSDSINKTDAKDSNETKRYAEDVSIDEAGRQSFEEAYDIREGKNQRVIGKEAGLIGRGMIEKLNAFFDTAFGFRYYSGRISKALASSTDDKTVKAVKKLNDVAEKDVRSADYVEIKVDSYMKDMENKVLSQLSAGEEHSFKMFMLMKSIANDENMPLDFEMRIGEASVTKDSAEDWLSDIDPGMEKKFDAISEKMHDVRMDWIVESMESSGVFSKEYTDFMKTNSSYVHISMINKDLKSFENDFNIDHVGNAFKVVKSKNYYKEGILEDVLTSTIKQDVAILHAMENNRRKLDVVASLTGIKALDSDVDISSKAKLSDVMDELVRVIQPNNMNQVRSRQKKGEWTDFTYDDVEIDGMSAVEYYENGIKRKVMIDKSVEAVFKDKDVNEMFNTVSQNKITTAIRSLYTTRNAGFVVFNFISDMIGTAVRVSPKALLKYPTAIRQAWKSVHGKEIDGVYKDLAKNGALFGEGNFRNLRKQNMRLVSYLKNSGGVKKKPHELLFNGFERFSGFIDNVNTTVERTSKFAASLHLKDKGYNNKDIAHIAREYAGSPNFMTGGYKFKTINNLFMFANPILRGYHQFSDSLFKRGSFTRNSAMGMLGLKVLTDIASRLLDDGPTDEEITQNGVHIPMGFSQDGSGEYMRSYYAKFPIDRTISDIGGLVSLSIMQIMKGFDNNDGTKGEVGKVLKGVLNQSPSLSPLITSILDVKEYATTGNITNSFGYNVLTRDEQYGTVGDNIGKVSKHFITSLGGQALLGKTLVNAATGQNKARIKEERFKDNESEYVNHFDFLGGTAAVAAIRDAGGMPIVGAVAGRFFKGSNYGNASSYANIINDARGIKAKERVAVTKSVENFLDNDYSDDDLINILTYPGELSRILTGYTGSSPLVKALSKVPKYDKEMQVKVLENWKQKRER